MIFLRLVKEQVHRRLCGCEVLVRGFETDLGAAQICRRRSVFEKDSQGGVKVVEHDVSLFYAPIWERCQKGSHNDHRLWGLFGASGRRAASPRPADRGT